jgi:hypothetical protein
MPTSVSKIENFSELKTAIADWLDRSDQDAVIPVFIQLTEKDMQQKLRHHKMVIKSYSNVDANDGVIALPSDWLEARNLEVGDIQITYQSPDVLDMFRNTDDGTSTTPRYYSFYDSNIEIWPVPSEDYTIEMDYYQTLPPLADSSNNTNWLLDISPNAYLYGSLVHSAPYLRDDTRVALWAKMYNEALLLLQGGSERAMTSGSRISRMPNVRLG